MNSFVLSDSYLSVIAKYNFNELWDPSLGHYAIKRSGGEYETAVSEIVSLNRYDLIFINVNRIREEYFWIPTIQDLLYIIFSQTFITGSNNDQTFHMFMTKESKDIIKSALSYDKPTLELCLIELLEEKSLIKRSSTSNTITTNGDPDKSISEFKEKFLREYV